MVHTLQLYIEDKALALALVHGFVRTKCFNNTTFTVIQILTFTLHLLVLKQPNSSMESISTSSPPVGEDQRVINSSFCSVDKHKSKFSILQILSHGT